MLTLKILFRSSITDICKNANGKRPFENISFIFIYQLMENPVSGLHLFGDVLLKNCLTSQRSVAIVTKMLSTFRFSRNTEKLCGENSC